jgi:hypothetical protein
MLNNLFIRSIGNATVEAAFNSYCGMFNHPPRQSILKEKWLTILSQKQIPFI